MNQTSTIRKLALPTAVTAWVSWFAIPPLFEAWTIDLFSRGAATALVIWILSLIWTLFDDNSLLLTPSSAWLSAAITLCLAGVLCKLNILLHLALAASLMGLLSVKFLTFTSAILASASLCWLPASGWLLSRLIPAEISPWLRISAAISFAMATFCVSRSKTDRKLRSRKPS